MYGDKKKCSFPSIKYLSFRQKRKNNSIIEEGDEYLRRLPSKINTRLILYDNFSNNLS